MTDKTVRDSLSRLYRIVEAGEKGYATAAANVPNQGLKILFKSYAQQRAKFKNEIMEELSRLGVQRKPAGSIPGAIHRGRVAIFAAMSLEKDSQERSILKETAIGERVAVRTYERTLKEDLPPQIHAMVEQQYKLVRGALEQVHLMRGHNGKMMVTRLFETEKDANRAVRSLQEAGFPASAIESTVFDGDDYYTGRGATVRETVLSGAFGGALWGSLTGLLVGFGVVQTNSHGPFGVIGAWILATLLFLLIGALIGGVLAFFIGTGISEDDRYDSRHMNTQPHILIRAVVDQARAAEAERIMDEVRPRAAQPVLKTIT